MVLSVHLADSGLIPNATSDRLTLPEVSVMDYDIKQKRFFFTGWWKAWTTYGAQDSIDRIGDQTQVGCMQGKQVMVVSLAH